MFLAREADQRMLKMQRQGRIGTFGPCTGQEAAVCAPAMAMTGKDWFAGSFRELGARLMLGDTFCNYLLYHNGFEEGSVLPKKTRLLPFSIIVGAQTLHAVGIAYAMNYKGEKDSAVVTVFGDGASSQGDVHEAMNFASVWKAPVVFICQNNQWAISFPRSRQTASETIAQKAIAYGMPGVQVDGNDPLAMYKATREALQRAYRGEGPTLIEAVTYRVMMHTTADDPTKYRDEGEVEAWRDKDPLIRFRIYMEKKGLWDETYESKLQEEIKAEVDRSVKEFEAITGFKPDSSFDYVYAEPGAELEKQRAEFLADLRKEAGHG
ncbi:MAG: pyruvate dehydrogenase (acetyl-transferring) E1 component subunit alpha, partial [Planctomycetes bacterium]|nr:pyruvate dehydrogenase (acetyl-transferring) E1 component subunit alpha [Planctomycetota bacterium]